eukprot:GHVU01105892.1.p1 GENE.GHVU01105892.1~~GHVU01105892.1.p1  ORF type:complete len:252 (-),score=29.70 GHVU01105892.1:198-953(-)
MQLSHSLLRVLSPVAFLHLLLIISFLSSDGRPSLHGGLQVAKAFAYYGDSSNSARPSIVTPRYKSPINPRRGSPISGAAEVGAHALPYPKSYAISPFARAVRTDRLLSSPPTPSSVSRRQMLGSDDEEPPPVPEELESSSPSSSSNDDTEAQSGLNKAQLVAGVAEDTHLPKKEVDEVVSRFLSRIREAVASGQRVSLSRFGSFEARMRSARTLKHPKTGELMELPPRRSPGFSASKGWREGVQKKFTSDG